MPRRLKNIRAWKGKLQAYTEIHGKTHARTFPLGTSTETMRAWVKKERETYGTGRAVAGSFAADIAEYLTRVTALTTYKQRADDLERWACALGHDRPRRTITAADIDRVMQDWLLAGSAPGTVKKRRMALLALWYKLDGKDKPNPVRGSQTIHDRKPEVRAIDYERITKILDLMTPGAQQLRARIIAWTGLPPKILMQVTPTDLDFVKHTVRVKPRRKGKGVEARTLPLMPQAVEAFRAFDAANAYGPFNGVNTNHYFKRACRRLDPPLLGYSLYDLRHSFLTMLYRESKDLATVARCALHANINMSQRYAMGANTDVDRRAVDNLGKRLSEIPVHKNNTNTDNILPS